MRIIKAFIKANEFPWITFKRYWKSASLSELLVDVFFPMLLSLLMVFFASLSIDKLNVLIEKIQLLSGQIVAAISILAGFNVTSITIISTINNASKEILRNRKNVDNTIDLYDMVICFFTWAVIIQLTVVLASVVLFFVGSFTPNELNNAVIPYWVWICVAIWLTLILHSIFLSIRNMKTLYLYVTYDKSKKNKINDSRE